MIKDKTVTLVKSSSGEILGVYSNEHNAKASWKKSFPQHTFQFVPLDKIVVVRRGEDSVLVGSLHTLPLNLAVKAFM